MPVLSRTIQMRTIQKAAAGKERKGEGGKRGEECDEITTEVSYSEDAAFVIADPSPEKLVVQIQMLTEIVLKTFLSVGLTANLGPAKTEVLIEF